MSVESKLKFRIGALLVAAFVVLTFIVGFLYALAISILTFLVWKAYTQIRLMNWWKNESPVTKKIIEYENQKLNEGASSKNLWVQSLTTPEIKSLTKDYRVEIMARPMMIEKQYSDLVEGWTVWGSTRLDDCVLTNDTEELIKENVGTEDHPITMLQLLIARAAFEITIAEFALGLLGISKPRQVLSQRMVANNLAERKSEMDIAWAAKSEMRASALKILSKELGE